MPKARVLIDVERLRQPNSGLGQVSLHLGTEFLAHPSDAWEPVFLIPENRRGIYGQDIAFEAPSRRRRYLPNLAPRYDLWHILHQDASYLPGAATPYVLTINDLNFLGEKSPPKAAKRLRKVQKLVDGATAITVISNYTETVVREHLEFGDTPIEVVYLGLCSDPGAAQTRPAFAPDTSFLFTLGVVRRKKNFHVLVDMLALLDGLSLIIAGNTQDAYADEIREQAQALGIGERVIIAGEIDDSHKIWLFDNCEAFVFPSLYEGFGLPVLEAMSFGKPTFSSALSSLPEVGGDDVFYWDNFEPQHMAEVFRSGLSQFHEDGQRASRLRARADEFTWRNTAHQYAQLYERILADRS